MNKLFDKIRERYFENITKGQKKAICYATILVLFGIFIFFIGEKKSRDNQAMQHIVAPVNYDGAKEFLIKFSNFSQFVKEWKFDDFWPKEYFDINLKAMKISYWKDTALVAEVEFKKGSNNNIKQFKDDISKQAFDKFPKIDNIHELVKNDYLKAINNAYLDENTRNLCFLYNALAGHSNNYILLGRNNSQDNWRFYTSSDFPHYCLRMDDKENILYNLVSFYADNIEKNPSHVPPLNESILDIVDSISVKAISLDYRGDIIYYGDKMAEAKPEDIQQLKAPYFYDSLYAVSACGWIVPDNNKEKIIRAKDYYNIDGNDFFITNDTFNNLNLLKWNDILIPDDNSIYLKYLGSILLFLGLICFLNICFRLIYKACKVRTSLRPDEKEELKWGNPSTIEEARTIIAELQKKLDKKNNAVEHFKKSNEFASIINDCKEKAVNDFKASKEFSTIIKESKEKAVNDFKENDEFKKIITNAEKTALIHYFEGNEYKNLAINASNWLSLLGCSTENQVLCLLQEIHNSINTFPVIRTFRTAYNEIKENTENEKSLIRSILVLLDEQMGITTGLQVTYDTLLKDAEYANSVHDSFESVKGLVQKFIKRKEYIQIVSQGKELNIWQRMAVMLWSMYFTNGLLEVFNKNSFTINTLKKAEDMHKDDIMQIYASRFFKKYMDDSSASAGKLTIDRDLKMERIISEIDSKYGIPMKETPSYIDFVKFLDYLHDKTKNENKYIQIMKVNLVDYFIRIERETKDKGIYLSLLVAMGLHMTDFIRYMSGNDIDYCPNLKYVLDGMTTKQLEINTEYRHNDPAYSGEYTNRVYEWLDNIGIEHLMALVGNKLIMP